MRQEMHFQMSFELVNTLDFQRNYAYFVHIAHKFVLNTFSVIGNVIDIKQQQQHTLLLFRSLYNYLRDIT